jgi:hypothetical protein
VSYEAALVWVVGARGTGKTTSAKAVTAHRIEARRAAGRPVRLLVFDPAEGRPADEWRPAGAVYVRGRAAFLEALAAGRYPIVVKEPVFYDFRPVDQMHDLLVVIDEAHRFADRRYMHESVSRLVLLGRHRDVDVVIATQRPGHLHPDACGNPTYALIHPLYDAADRERVERGLGISLRGRTWRKVPGTLSATEPLVFPRDFEREGAPEREPAEASSRQKGTRGVVCTTKRR